MPGRLPLRERVSFVARATRHVLANPRQAPTLPRWLRDRGASPLDLRIPWWPYTLPPWLLTALPAGGQVFEFGAGGSTLWLEDHGFRVASVESDAGWHGALTHAVRKPTTNLALVEASETGEIGSVVEPGYFDAYIGHVDGCGEASLDLVVVDGRCRVECGLRAISKIRAGGHILLDDSDRPRYGPLRDALASWESRTFTALRPGGIPPGPTTVWTKP